MPNPGICVANSDATEEWLPIMSLCRKISLVWAVGGSQVQDFPPDLAYPMGGPDAEFKYFFLEMHYDNPQQAPSIYIGFYITFLKYFIDFVALI